MRNKCVNVILHKVLTSVPGTHKWKGCLQRHTVTFFLQPSRCDVIMTSANSVVEIEPSKGPIDEFERFSDNKMVNAVQDEPEISSIRRKKEKSGELV